MAFALPHNGSHHAKMSHSRAALSVTRQDSLFSHPTSQHSVGSLKASDMKGERCSSLRWFNEVVTVVTAGNSRLGNQTVAGEYLLNLSDYKYLYPGNSSSYLEIRLWSFLQNWPGGRNGFFLESKNTHTLIRSSRPPWDHTDTSFPPTLWCSSSIHVPFCAKYFTSGWLFHGCFFIRSPSARMQTVR